MHLQFHFLKAQFSELAAFAKLQTTTRTSAQSSEALYMQTNFAKLQTQLYELQTKLVKHFKYKLNMQNYTVLRALHFCFKHSLQLYS